MKYSIERIEEKIAVCEDDDGAVIKISVTELPKTIREGDIIIKTASGYEISSDETEARRHEMAKLQRSIFGKKR